ncbi:ATP-binding protein [Nocardioides panacihumi]|uniref:histidine kinase n=1 Tax=Nocardioides panacihumi TaxID=400774 RepID=A0ABN2RFH3_9ACTN
MDVADLRPIALFDGVSDDQLAELLDDGAEVRFGRGDVIFREGEHADFWWVLVDGSLTLTRRLGDEDAVVGRMAMPGVWSGGFRAWDQQGVYLATGCGEEPGRLLQVPAEALGRRLRAWLPLGVHLINGIFGTARRIEATVRQRDSLVTLGRLSAGLAHELNNPAAAAVRAVAALEETSAALLASLRGLAEHGISAGQFTALDALRLDLGGRPRLRDPVAVADREDALTEWLEEHDVAMAWELAPVLAAAGAEPAWCDQVRDVLGADLQPGLEWVAATLSSTALLGEVRESTRRISELVSAVRSYSQMDRGSRQSTDVTEGLESTLVMLGHKVSEDISVVRDYGDDVPAVDAFPGELNQVWTNLIDNALDAMEGSGTLRISTRLDGDHVVVEVGDSGPGMAPDVEARAFEAFFTTKDVGQGTGLGLDIARRIVVDRHRGQILIHPEPGDNVMEVRLPLTQPQA